LITNVGYKEIAFWKKIQEDILIGGKHGCFLCKFCISNKVREIHLNSLSNTKYIQLMWLSNFVDIGKECTFCNNCEESLNHLFVDCQCVKSF